MHKDMRLFSNKRAVEDHANETWPPRGQRKKRSREATGALRESFGTLLIGYSNKHMWVSVDRRRDLEEAATNHEHAWRGTHMF